MAENSPPTKALLPLQNITEKFYFFNIKIKIDVFLRREPQNLNNLY